MTKELTSLENDLKLVDVVNNEIVVSSLQVAERFGKEHFHIMRDIRNLIKDIGVSKIGYTPKMFKETTYINQQNNQEYPMCLMNRDGFSLLVMGFTGKDALEWKLKYIEAFNSMEHRLKLIEQQELGRLMERIRSKEARKTLTDEIKESVPESPHKKFIYKHYTDLVYKVVFGMNAKQLREKLNISKTDNIRDYLSKDELNKIIAVESVIRGYLKIGKDYDDIKNLTSNILPQQ